MTLVLDDERPAAQPPTEGRKSVGHQARHDAHQRAIDWLLAIAVTITTWTDINRLATSWVDDSWRFTLTEAASRGVDFGTDIAFTYGPLVFLDGGPIHTTSTGAAALVVRFALATATALLVVRTARASGWARWIQLAAAWVFVAAVVPPDRYSEVGVIVVCAWITRSLLVEGHVPLPGLLAAAAVAGIWMSVKPSAAIILLAVAGVAALPARPGTTASGLVSGRRRWESAALHAVGRAGLVGAMAIAALAAAWSLSGQALTSLPGFLSGWLEVSGGFASGMAHGIGNLLLAEIVLVATGTGLGVLAIQRVRRAPTAANWTLLGTTSLLLFWSRQIGMARPDEAHLKDVGALIALLTVACWPVLDRRLRPLLITIGIGMVAALSLIPVPAVLDVAPVVGSIRELATELTDLGDGRMIDRSRNDIRAHYGLSQSTVDLTRGEPVHISPQDTNVAFAHPDLGFWVLPTVQHFVSYTEELEERNVAALTGPRGPAFVLHRPRTDVEFHHAAWESPRLIQTLWCHFRPVRKDGDWSLLEARGAGCDAPEIIGEPVAVSHRVAVPAETRACEGLVTFRIFGAARTGLDRLALLLVRQPRPFVTTQDESWPFIPGTAAQPHVLAAPVDDVAWLGAGVPETSDLDLVLQIDDLDGYFGPVETPTIQFECWKRSS